MPRFSRNRWRQGRWAGPAAAGIAAALSLVLAACSGGAPQAVTAHGPNLAVSAAPEALDGGASIRIVSDHNPASTPSWPASVQVTPPLQIEPTKGRLHGQATLVFHYPQHLPAGLSPQDLMVTVYNPDVRARVPLPFTLNERARTLTVISDHFSQGWGEQGANPQVVKDAQGFALDAAGDAAKNHGDAVAGWMNRLLPPPPEFGCDPGTYALTFNVTDYGTPDAHTACAQGTNNPDVVTLKVANTHSYPVEVTLPAGVTLMPDVNAGDGFEEVVSQLVAGYADTHKFLLRGNHQVNLEVRLSQLQSGAQIFLQPSLALLLEDMALWTIDMGMDQKGAAWEKLNEVKDAHDTADAMTVCFQQAAMVWQSDQHDQSILRSGDHKKIADLAQKTLDGCAKPTAKAVHGLLGKLWDKTKKTANKVADTAVMPVERMIHQFKVLWDNPGMLWEWTEGLIAWTSPEHAGRVTIALSKADFAMHLQDALPAPGEFGFQTNDGTDTRGMLQVEREDILPPEGSNASGYSSCNTQGGENWAIVPKVAAGGYFLGSPGKTALAQNVNVALVPLGDHASQAVQFLSSLRTHCAFAGSRYGPVTADLVRTANFGNVTRVYHVVSQDGTDKLEYMSVSGGYYLYVEATAVPGGADSDGFMVDAATHIGEEMVKLDETLGTHFQPSRGSTPGGAWASPSPAQQPAVSIQSLVGSWSGHSRDATISASGLVRFNWRTYTVCGSAGATPGHACEPASNPYSEGGHATLQLMQRGGGIVAQVLRSNDTYVAGTYPVVILLRGSSGRPSAISIGQHTKLLMTFCTPVAPAGYCGA